MLSFSRKSQLKSITEISEITRLREAIAKCSFDSFLVFDFDNTLAEATQELGSDQWFEKLMAYASGLDLKGENACDLVITIYRAVQAHVRARAVEAEIVNPKSITGRFTNSHCNSKRY